MLCNKCGKFPFCEHADADIHECDKYVKRVVNLMECDDEELKATLKNIGQNKEMSLYEMDQEEKRLIKELKYIIADANLTSDWRTTIEDTIKLLETKGKNE